MAIDPKNTGVRLPVSLPVTKPATPAAPAKAETWAAPTPATGFTPDSGFEATARRAALSNDSEGVKRKGSGADDTIGVKRKGSGADDTIGVKRKGSGADDTIGVKKQGSGADDTIGGSATTDNALRDALFADTPAAAAQRQALFTKLETPSFVKTGSPVAAQVTRFAASAGLSSAEQAQVATVLKGASDSTASLMGALLEKNPAALKTADSTGQTLLSNLTRLASEPLNAKATGTSRAEVLESVLRDVVNPQRVEQGDAPTCTVTSMQYELVADEPAEFARIIADLTGPAGQAAMRGDARGQGKLVLDGGETAARDNRSVADTIFQNAAMEYANGVDSKFDPFAQKSVNQKTGAEQRGIKPTQQSRLLGELFGVSYRQAEFYTPAEGASALEKLRTYSAAGAQNRPVILQVDQGDFNHAVTFDKVQDGRVFYRDPYGVLRSMPEDQFPKFVVALNAPTSLGISY